ncbi:MAG: YdcH family protein [Rhodomicrobium sp.]
MSTSDDRVLRQKLAQLRQEHRNLDNAILALEGAAERDQLRLTRLKKRKLSLKDEIARIEDQLLPDIIA